MSLPGGALSETVRRIGRHRSGDHWRDASDLGQNDEDGNQGAPWRAPGTRSSAVATLHSRLNMMDRRKQPLVSLYLMTQVLLSSQQVLRIGKVNTYRWECVTVNTFWAIRVALWHAFSSDWLCQMDSVLNCMLCKILSANLILNVPHLVLLFGA